MLTWVEGDVMQNVFVSTVAMEVCFEMLEVDVILAENW